MSTTFRTPPHPRNPQGWPIAWGPQLDIRPVNFTKELTDTSVAGYLAKYATKSSETTGHLSTRITTDTINSYRTLATQTPAWSSRAGPSDNGRTRKIPSTGKKPTADSALGSHARPRRTPNHQITPLLHHPQSPQSRTTPLATSLLFHRRNRTSHG